MAASVTLNGDFDGLVSIIPINNVFGDCEIDIDIPGLNGLCKISFMLVQVIEMVLRKENYIP